MQLSEGLAQDVLQGSRDQAARASELGGEPGCGFRMSAADMANVDSPAAPLASSAAAEAFVDAGRVSCHSVGEPVRPNNAASVRSSQQSVSALGASEGDAQMRAGRRFTTSDAAARGSQLGAGVVRGSTVSTGAAEPRHSIVQHSGGRSTTGASPARAWQLGAEVARGDMVSAGAIGPPHFTVQHSDGLGHGALQGSRDQAARASELGVELGRGSRTSAADMANVDSLAATSGPPAAPGAFVDAGRVSLRPTERQVHPKNAASFRPSQQSVAALRAAEDGAQMIDARRSTASDAAARVSQLGAKVACGSTMSIGTAEPRGSTVEHSEGLTHDASEPGAEPCRSWRMSAPDMGISDQSHLGHGGSDCAVDASEPCSMCRGTGQTIFGTCTFCDTRPSVDAPEEYSLQAQAAALLTTSGPAISACARVLPADVGDRVLEEPKKEEDDKCEDVHLYPGDRVELCGLVAPACWLSSATLGFCEPEIDSPSRSALWQDSASCAAFSALPYFCLGHDCGASFWVGVRVCACVGGGACVCLF